MPSQLAPYFPIIYVRGFAMTDSEIAATTATPYMGFNLGSTKLRQSWDKKVQRHIFESPLIRLMKDYGYRDSFADGSELEDGLPAKSVVIYRYYESADSELGMGEKLSIPAAAAGLKALIHKLKQQVCGHDPELHAQFKVHLVAHSMGGLIVRSFLQNDNISNQSDRDLVAKVFTYATPHNGIDMAGFNVPKIFGWWDVNNFNRQKIAEFLGLPGKPERVDSLAGKFDPQRFFCFVGTNHRDYDVALGASRLLAGEMSDGLVKMENATVAEAPRAFAYRSHSGPYGVVNSEEGYQNLVRFLFGDVRADGHLEVAALPLPPSVQQARDAGREIRASYYFEASVAPRGVVGLRLTERRRDTYSAILRSYDELLRVAQTPLAAPRSPVLFSVFLDTDKITVGRTLVFALDLAVSTTGYTIDKKFWPDQHVEGEYLFRDTLIIRITRSAEDFKVRYLNANEKWSEASGRLAEKTSSGYAIPLSSNKGFQATLQLDVRSL